MPIARDDAEEPLARLRGAGVDVDPRRAGRIASALAVLALLGTGAGLAAGAASKNAQIDALRSKGVAVQMTVSGCRGLLGGSGSNLAGYTCQGSYRLDGRLIATTVPGGAFHEAGSHVRVIAATGEPGLVASPVQVASERASLRAFLVPVLLILCALAASAGLAWRWMRSPRAAREAPGASSGRPAPA